MTSAHPAPPAPASLKRIVAASLIGTMSGRFGRTPSFDGILDVAPASSYAPWERSHARPSE